MGTQTDQHDADRRLQRMRDLRGDRMADDDRGTREDKERQRMAKPPCQAVFDDIPDIGSACRNAGNRRDVIGFERMLHSQQKAQPQNSEHA